MRGDRVTVRPVHTRVLLENLFCSHGWCAAVLRRSVCPFPPPHLFSQCRVCDVCDALVRGEHTP